MNTCLVMCVQGALFIEESFEIRLSPALSHSIWVQNTVLSRLSFVLSILQAAFDSI